MDNVKTGVLIKELRKEKNLTQKELAEILHITDKAVSKWERGLCAPDISLLEQLAEVLNLSIAELVGGERNSINENITHIEEASKTLINYLKNEIVYKTKSIKKKFLLITLISIVAVVIIAYFFLWRIDYFGIIADRSFSIDAEKVRIIDGDNNHNQIALEIREMIFDSANIKDCLVILSQNAESSYSRDNSDSRVSIVLTTADNEKLLEQEVQNILELIRYIIPEIKNENISITDSNLNVYLINDTTP